MAPTLKILYTYLVILFQILCYTSVTRAQPKKVKLKPEDVINATEQHVGTVFFLHGACDIGQYAKLQILDVNPNFSFPHVKVLFPTAPKDMYMAFDGMETHIWYNRPEISLKVPEDVKSIERTWRSFKKLIDAEVEAGIPLNRIIVGGFSMGGGFALQVGYKFLPEIGGVFAMSSYLNVNSSVYDEVKGYTGKFAPLFMTHSEADTEIPFYWGHLTYMTLHDHGVKGTFYHEQNAIHEISTKQMNMVYDWIYNLIPNPNPTTTGKGKETPPTEYLPKERDSSDLKDPTRRTTTTYATRSEEESRLVEID